MYGELVRRARRGCGLTQTELSAISGIEQSNISAIENGRRIPTAATLHRLLFACGYCLAAVAGERVLSFPPPEGDDFLDEDASSAEPEERRPIPMATRVRMVTAALDASEAIVRGR